MSDPLSPSASLLCKLGSIAVHAEEAMSDDRHEFDITALRQLLFDVEVCEWMVAMDQMAMLPKMRKPRPSAGG